MEAVVMLVLSTSVAFLGALVAWWFILMALGTVVRGARALAAGREEGTWVWHPPWKLVGAVALVVTVWGTYRDRDELTSLMQQCRDMAPVRPYSSEELARMKAILASAMQESPSVEARREYWALLDRARMSPDKAAELRATVTTTNVTYMRCLYADVKTSLETGRPHLSAERAELERRLGIPPASVKENAELVRKVAAHEEIVEGDPESVATEESIAAAMATLGQTEENLKLLLTRPSPPPDPAASACGSTSTSPCESIPAAMSPPL